MADATASLSFPLCLDRHEEDEETAGGDEGPWWHRRQSKEERLADAAEARLLGLAGRPGSVTDSGNGSEHGPPDWHLRRHQPVSYSRPGMQVPACTHPIKSVVPLLTLPKSKSTVQCG